MATKKEEVVIDAEVKEDAPVEEKQAKKVGVQDAKAAASATASALKGAVDSVSKTVSSALEDRANVVMVRVNDDALRHMDMLVESEITKSRSESAALLINEGVKANQALFAKMGDITDQIADLRAQLREVIKVEDEEAAADK